MPKWALMSKLIIVNLIATYEVMIILLYIVMLQENMTRMLMVTDVHDIIKRHQAQIITSLKDPDIRFNSSFLCQCTSKSRMAGLSDVVAHSFA